MSDTLALKCPSCGSPLQAQDFDLSNGTVSCGYCRVLIPIAGSTANLAATESKPQAPLPLRTTIRQTSVGVEIQRRWFTIDVFVMMFFCIFWDAAIISIYSKAMKPGASWTMFVFPLGHVAVGVWLTYSTIAKFFNRTRIAVDRGQLIVSHGPIPWAGNLIISGTSIDQLYCKEKPKGGRWGRVPSYEVWAVLTDGSAQKIAAAGLDQDQALYIEQEIERALNIKHRPVAGEVRA